MNTDDVLSREITELIDRTAVRAFNVQTEEIVGLLDEVKSECLDKTSSSDEKLEVKRRIAGWEMRLLCDRNERYELVRQAYENTRQLGHLNLDNEGSAEIYFAQYCMQNSMNEEAKQILEQLCYKLETAYSQENREIYSHLKEYALEKLSSLS